MLRRLFQALAPKGSNLPSTNIEAEDSSFLKEDDQKAMDAPVCSASMPVHGRNLMPRCILTE